MIDVIQPARIAEPVTVPCIFVDEIDLELGDAFVRIVGLVRLETVEFAPPEKRIVARAVMPLSVARELIRDLRVRLARGGD